MYRGVLEVGEYDLKRWKSRDFLAYGNFDAIPQPVHTTSLTRVDNHEPIQSCIFLFRYQGPTSGHRAAGGRCTACARSKCAGGLATLRSRQRRARWPAAEPRGRPTIRPAIHCRRGCASAGTRPAWRRSGAGVGVGVGGSFAYADASGYYGGCTGSAGWSCSDHACEPVGRDGHG